MKIGKLSLVLLMVVCMSVAVGIPSSDAAYFDGKTVTLIAGGSAGGGMDLSCRAIAPFLKKHVPGNPNMVVKNMGAAGGTKARNLVYEKSKRDGTVLMWGSWAPVAQAIGEPGMRAKFVEMGFIGGISATYLNIVSTEQHPEIKGPADLFKAQPLKVGGLRATSAADLLSRLSLDVMGVKHTYVTGYRGNAKIFAAMMQKEVDFMSPSVTFYTGRVLPTLVKQGKAIALWHHPRTDGKGGFQPNRAAEYAPAFIDAYKQVHGKAPAGIKWDALKWVSDVCTTMLRGLWAPPKVNEEALAALRKGFSLAIRDQEYIDMTTKRFGKLDFVEVEAGNRAVDLLRTADPKLLKFLDEYIKSGTK